MATKVSEIYCLNEVIKNDPKMSKLPEYIFNSISFKYLKLAIGFCKTVISSEASPFINNIDVAIEPTEGDYEFIGDGIENVFLLNPPPPLNSKFYVGFEVDGEFVETKDFTFNDLTDEITTTDIPELNQRVLIVSYTDGEFVGVLDYTMQGIMAEAMLIPYLEEKQNKANLLNQLVHSNAWRIFSQNDHLRGMNFVVRDQRNYVSRMLVDYSYANTGNRMAGLVGKQV